MIGRWIHNSLPEGDLVRGRRIGRPPVAAALPCRSGLSAAAILAIVILLAILWSAIAVPARGEALVLAAIKEIDHSGLYSQRFRLERDARVQIDAVGSGWPDEEILFSYAWLLNLNDRSVAWAMDWRDVEADRNDNVSAAAEIDLVAGDYALYFSALGGFFPIKQELKVLKLFRLGTFNIEGGTLVAWDRYGQPAKWKAVVRAADPGFLASDYVANPPVPEQVAPLAFREAGSGEYYRAALDVRQSIRVRILAVGEYVAREQGFADGAWIEDQDDCLRVWEMTLRNTEPAGGAKKNRVFDDLVELAPGRYLLCYVSDDSHAFGDWNAPPPFDPESWGVTLLPDEPLPDGAMRVVVDPPDENLIARIDRVGDAEFHRIGFELRRESELCVRGFGELGSDKERLVDYGWIEDARTLGRVWTMQGNVGLWAGGESRNRLVQERVHLAAGSYYLCYVSDYAHAYPRWSKTPPYDPRSWGIALHGLGPGFDAATVREFDESEGPTAIVRLAPVGDDEHRRVSFVVSEPMRVKVIAMGEGSRGEMYDYGWLTRKDDGQTIWTMDYDQSSPAGGGRKNRRVEEFLTLEPGEYTLHFESDGSHSIDGWNDEPPEEPQYWGVTLIEWPTGL